MKTSWLLPMCMCCAGIILHVRCADAQPWPYDFGTGTGTHSTGVSTTFLPVPPSGSARVRIGSQGGSLQCINPGDPRLGSGSEAVLTAPTGSSLNKLQWHDFAGARCFSLRMQMIIGGGPGDAYFFCGNGSSFSDNVGFSSSQVFAALRWKRDSLGVQLAVRGPSGWNTLSSSPMMPDSVHLLEIYANNSNSSNTYQHGSSESVAAHACDIWVDDLLIVDDQQSAGLADSSDIDSFMFYMAASPANDCRLSLDDIVFTSSIAAQPLPVELRGFEARLQDRVVILRWKTETELQNFGFEIQRSSESRDWRVRGFVPGDGDRQTPRWYSWSDTLQGETGRLHYRLRQIDRDGTSALSDECVIEGFSPGEGFRLGAPWPNPARESITLPIYTPGDGIVRVKIISLAGKQDAVLTAVRFLPAGVQDLRLSCGYFPRGLHLLTVHSDFGVQSRLVLLN